MRHCECENREPKLVDGDNSAEYVQVGNVDYQVCANCGFPISGTATSHDDDTTEGDSDV